MLASYFCPFDYNLLVSVSYEYTLYRKPFKMLFTVNLVHTKYGSPTRGPPEDTSVNYVYTIKIGAWGSVVVKALCY